MTGSSWEAVMQAEDLSAPPIHRLAVRREEAAAALGVSVDFFDEHIRPDLPIIVRGRLTLYPVAELDAWVQHNTLSLGARS